MMAEIAAATYGGAEVSWATVELVNIALVMVGRVNLMPNHMISQSEFDNRPKSKDLP